jgi:hypothetical protein
MALNSPSSIPPEDITAEAFTPPENSGIQHTVPEYPDDSSFEVTIWPTLDLSQAITRISNRLKELGFKDYKVAGIDDKTLKITMKPGDKYHAFLLLQEEGLFVPTRPSIEEIQNTARNLGLHIVRH